LDGIAANLRRHECVGLDTSPFIYHIEGVSLYATTVDIVFDELIRGTFAGVTSVLTLMELTVKPLQLGFRDVADEYEMVLSTYPSLTIVGFDQATARRAAELRAIYRLRPADALQVAACLQGGATAFLTNDRGLRRVTEEIHVLLLEDFIDQE
jgi:predicted nucleic acid-binding protein